MLARIRQAGIPGSLDRESTLPILRSSIDSSILRSSFLRYSLVARPMQSVIITSAVSSSLVGGHLEDM